MKRREKPAYDYMRCCICYEGLVSHKTGGHGMKRLTPLILKCTHSACNVCIFVKTRDAEPIICDVCKVVSPLPNGFRERDIRAAFPPNAYLIGLSACIQDNRAINESVIGTFAKETTIPSFRCGECAKSATSLCEICRAHFCQTCFSKVHSAAKILKHHKSVAIVHDSAPKLNNSCSIHPANKLQFFCEQCDTAVCSSCLVPDHNEHKLQKISDVNRACRSKILEAYADLEHSRHLLKASIQKAKSMLHSSVEDPAKDMESQVREHFIQIHSQLVLLEKNLLNDIDSLRPSRALKKTITQTEENIERINRGIAKIETGIQMEDSADFNFLLNEMQELIDLPNVFVPTVNTEAKSSLTIDPTIFKQLEDHIRLNLENTLSCEMKPVAEAPESALEALGKLPDKLSTDHVEEKLDDVTNTVKCPAPEETKGPTLSRPNSVSSTGSSNSMNSFKVELPLLEPPEEFFAGMLSFVKVSHFKDPSEFYVQRQGHSMLQIVEKELRRFANSNHALRKKKVIPKIGNIYMVLYTDGDWSRCRLSEILGGNKARVFYVDFGNTGTVDIEHLNLLPSSLQKLEHQVHRCTLDNCHPVDETWSEEAFLMTLRILELEGRTAIRVISVENDSTTIAHVRLMKEADVALIDVGEALVFSKHARSNPKGSRPKPLPNSFQHYPVRFALQTKSITATWLRSGVEISHVVSPDEFYVVMRDPTAEQGKIISGLLEKIENCKDDRMIYYPVVGLAVIVGLPDGKYARGRITEVVSEVEVEVFFVDKGNTSLCRVSNLKYANTDLTKIPPLAFKCFLAGIEPVEAGCWSVAASELLKSFEGEHLMLNLLKFINGRHGVELFQKSDAGDEIFVNTLFTEKQLAKWIRKKRAAHHRRPVLRAPTIEKTAPMPSVSTTSEDPKRAASSVGLTLDTSDGNAIRGQDGVYRIKVTIVKFVDPGQFFVTVDGYDKVFDKLLEEMNQFYNSEATDEAFTKKWEVGDYCVTKVDGKWVRGMIAGEPDEEKNLLVKLNDELKEIKVFTDDPVSLKPLDSRFRKVNERVIECCLGGILPAGSSSWSATSIEYSSNKVKLCKKRLYISMMEQHNPDATVLPVELFFKKKVKATAFSPESYSWKSLNHSLRMEGLAKPDEFTKWSSDGKRECSGTARRNIMEDGSEEMFNLLKARFQVTEQGDIDLSKPRLYQKGRSDVSWLPPKPLENFEFLARPTFIGTDCSVYLQDENNSKKTLELICKEVNEVCNGSLPLSHLIMWEPGDICLVRYDLDKKWYRGEILNDDAGRGTYLVRFVDYGNDEFVLPEDIRPFTDLDMRSIQCYKCFFDDLAPRGITWDITAIETIHALIVDKLCNVKLRILSNGLIGISEMILPDGRNAVDTIISLGLGVSLIDRDILLNSAKSGTSDEEDDTETISPEKLRANILWPLMHQKVDRYEFPEGNYRLMEVPKEIDRFEVTVSSALTQDLLFLEIVKSEVLELKAWIEEFDKLVETMKKECPYQPPIQPPYLWKHCCTTFWRDDDWSRSIVIKDNSATDGILYVQSVDYGEVTQVPVDRVRQVKKYWIEVPTRSVTACIDGYKYSDRVSPSEAMTMLIDCFQEVELWANVKKHERDLIVELLDSEGNLAYQRLIDEGVLIPV